MENDFGLVFLSRYGRTCGPGVQLVDGTVFLLVVYLVAVFGVVVPQMKTRRDTVEAGHMGRRGV
jgi:hypothetical protein